jgi:hypothetical protein
VKDVSARVIETGMDMMQWNAEGMTVTITTLIGFPGTLRVVIEMDMMKIATRAHLDPTGMETDTCQIHVLILSPMEQYSGEKIATIAAS